jgi:tetratricopeptide (TPR) repeat protein
MPEGAREALPLLERALAVEPDYALAHGYAAWCHENLFVRAGRCEEDRQGAIRHAHAALAHGRDDAMALTLGGFNIGMVEHDRATARDAFDAAIALSPSTAFTYMLGGVVLGLAGDAERAIEWGEKALRLSPLDPLSWNSWNAVYLGNFRLNRYQKSANAIRKAIQWNPGFSIGYMFLAGVWSGSAWIDEAKAPPRVSSRQPGFSIGGYARHSIPCRRSPPCDACAQPVCRNSSTSKTRVLCRGRLVPHAPALASSVRTLRSRSGALMRRLEAPLKEAGLGRWKSCRGHGRSDDR